MRPLLPFVILPIVEIALFIKVGGAIGVLPTLALVVLSAVAGVAVMRRQGAVAVLDIQRAMAEFRDPARPLAHGALVMLAGALLVVPGLLTSAVGLLLLVRPLRDLVITRMSQRRGVRVTGAVWRQREAEFMGDFPAGFGRGDRPGPGGVIDGEYSVQDDPPAPVREGLAGPRRADGSGWTQH
jgi:UPF0716 protein FxsA